jgi:hypothetical protein
MGIFGEEFEDGFVHGIANVTFAGVNGDTGVFETEPAPTSSSCRAVRATRRSRRTSRSTPDRPRS